jgi:hypothetical protein
MLLGDCAVLLVLFLLLKPGAFLSSINKAKMLHAHVYTQAYTSTHIYFICTYTDICMYTYVCVCMCVYAEKEGEKERERQR